MAVNTVYSNEIHPRALWMTLGASVHWLRFWQPRAGSSKILLNMETHAVLAERQRSNTLSKARFREEGGKKKLYAHSQKAANRPSALQTGKSNTTFTCCMFPFQENFHQKHCRYKYSYIVPDSWRRAVLQKHIAYLENLCPKKCLFFPPQTIRMTFL